MDPYARRTLEKLGIIGGLTTGLVGAYLSAQAPVAGTIISLSGCVSAYAGAVSRSWRIQAEESAPYEQHTLEERIDANQSDASHRVPE